MRPRSLHARARSASGSGIGPGQGGHSLGKVNVTPLIDVVMCLIIFFLIVGRLAAHKPIQLPESDAGDDAKKNSPIVVEIIQPGNPESKEPLVMLAGRAVDLTALAAAVKDAVKTDGSEKSQRPVHLRAQRDLPYAMLSPVLKVCRGAGLTSVRLVTERSR